MVYLYYTVNIMAAYGLLMQIAEESAAIYFHWFT